MLPKASSLKRAALTQKEHEIQLGLEIEDNNNAINICGKLESRLSWSQKYIKDPIGDPGKPYSFIK
jgi:hypothetical protein